MSQKELFFLQNIVKNIFLPYTSEIKILIFRLFTLLVFMSQRGIFSFQNIDFLNFLILQPKRRSLFQNTVKLIFLAYKKIEKLVNCGSKPWTNPFCKNMNFLTFQASCFYSLKRRFPVLEYPKKHFPGLNCLKKKKMKKMANFGPKSWTNSVGKISICPLFQLLVFIAQKSVFSFQNILKHIFLAYTDQNKNIEKNGQFLTKTMN